MQAYNRKAPQKKVEPKLCVSFTCLLTSFRLLSYNSGVLFATRSGLGHYLFVVVYSVEYHWMNSKESKDTQQGAMVSVDRHIVLVITLRTPMIDLSDTTGTAKGWFLIY